MIAIDHVIVATTDARGLAATLLDRTGLAAVEGGRHPGHGTGNWVVPLGGSYLELLEVVDEAEARTSPFGSWALEQVDGGLAIVVLRTDDVDAVATRLDRPALAMSRRTPDGDELRWRLVALDDAIGPQRLPAFIEWDVAASAHPGALPAPHGTEPLGITALQLGGPVEDVASWLGQHDLSIELVGGDPGPHQATLATTDGPVLLTRDGLA